MSAACDVTHKLAPAPQRSDQPLAAPLSLSTFIQLNCGIFVRSHIGAFYGS